ncbi:hypothetical protein [Methylobacterium haplocladii]|uniref:Uncharacterized protein n=1 Tax=Methylobacterium haplocladii TaxID=1176176 RepID=A0A512ISF8_9HYPH|nr:hypothetical protein [Methylobacterium haplocladii]GEP00579.1 hypothetical protein MHA02_29660 [Methylobacterium haplocladii]GJD85494.1 hypothetical protein HPGCJGGD_3383 [Methylobacterium haplocladii]GLS57727.1 hypothetical protein GCM10007887_03830 [Methylobacterium haplocladii]
MSVSPDPKTSAAAAVDKLPIVITRDDGRYFAIEAAGRRAVGLGFDEMLGAVVGLAHPELTTVPAYMRGAGSLAVAKDAPSATITIPLALAESISAEMADLLCWCRGFVTALPDNADRHPMGLDLTREMRIRLDVAIAAAKGIEPQEFPF